MHFSEFDSFRAELRALGDAAQSCVGKTVRDESLRERFRLLFRSWASTVEPSIRDHVQNRRDVFKLSAEIEKLAQLSAKIAPVQTYKDRIRTATRLADEIVIYLPTAASPPAKHTATNHDLFLSGIPDLPTALVPNPIVGWRSRMEVFLKDHPFDKSVFVMIRYRPRTKVLIEMVKKVLDDHHLFGVVASDHRLTDDLYNPVACLLCCSRGIAIFDRAEENEVFNPNVAYELGMMNLLSRDCLILKHSSLKSLQTDILMKLYTRFTTHQDVGRCTEDWLAGPVTTLRSVAATV